LYAELTKHIFGKVLPHDDSTNDDRSPDSMLTNSFVETKKLWLLEFKEDFDFAGGMYRGQAPYFCTDFSKSETYFSPSFYNIDGFYYLEEAQ
jgi:hypothetical protein